MPFGLYVVICLSFSTLEILHFDTQLATTLVKYGLRAIEFYNEAGNDPTEKTSYNLVFILL